jgi:hypothetical protein
VKKTIVAIVLLGVGLQVARARMAVYLWPTFMCYAGAQATGSATTYPWVGQLNIVTGTVSFRENRIRLGNGREEISVFAEDLSVAPADRLPPFGVLRLRGEAGRLTVSYSRSPQTDSFAVLSEDLGDPPLAFGQPLEMASFRMNNLTISTFDGTRLAIRRLDLQRIRTGFGFRSGIASLSASGVVDGLELAQDRLVSGNVTISNGYALLRDANIDCGHGQTAKVERVVVALTPPFSSEMRPSNGCQ